jgi:hypothetical protein
MPALNREHSTLLVIDIQGRLMPAIADGPAVIANARCLVDAAALLEVPVLFTEQNPGGLGQTVPELTPSAPWPQNDHRRDTLAGLPVGLEGVWLYVVLNSIFRMKGLSGEVAYVPARSAMDSVRSTGEGNRSNP